MWRIVPLLWLPVILWRIYVVIRRPDALSASKGGIAAKVFRNVGIVLMVAGLVATVALLFRRPLTLLLFRHTGDDGIAFVIVGICLYLLSCVGMVGVAAFEISRHIAGKQKNALAEQKDNE